MAVLQTKCFASHLCLRWRQCPQFHMLSSHANAKLNHPNNVGFVRPLSSSSVAMMRKPLAKQFLDKMRIRDQVSPDYGLVYNNKLTSYILGARGTAGVLGLGTLGILAVGIRPSGILSTTSIKYSESDFKGLFAFFVANICAIMWTVKYVPLRIYYSDQRDNFIMITSHGLLPWKEEKIICECDAMDINPSGSKIMAHYMPSSSAYIVNGTKKIVLQREYFSSAVFFRKLMGYYQEDGDNKD